jgi:hypothetical protein|tara:strand:- start:258 stop:464 length:207 start_codon:yes stop_codon:yes gene_type:complete
MIYNSRGFLGFSVYHETEDWEKSITADAIRLSIIKRLASMDDAELISEVQLEDTIEEEEEVELKWTNQ